MKFRCASLRPAFWAPGVDLVIEKNWGARRKVELNFELTGKSFGNKSVSSRDFVGPKLH